MTADVAVALDDAIALHRAGRIAEAAALYETILGVQPDCAPALHLRGVAARQDGDVVTALRLIGRALALAPDLPGIGDNLSHAVAQAHTLAVGHVQEGRWAEAGMLYRSVLDAAPGNAAARRNRDLVVVEALAEARDHLRRGDADGAIRLLDRLLRVNPQHAEILRERAALAQQSGDAPLAADLLARASALRPADGGIQLQRGIACAACSRWQEAVNAFRTLETLEPGNPVAVFNLGLVLLNLQRRTEAVAVFRRFLAVCADTTASWDTRLFAREVIAQQPFLTRCNLLLGALLRRRGNLDEAADAFRQAIAFDDARASTYRGLAGCLRQAGRLADAAEACQRGLRLAPDAPALRREAAAIARAGEAPPSGPPPEPRPAVHRLADTPRPRWAIVPGILRDLANFRHILHHVLRLRSEGLLDGIVVSTWDGQITGAPGMARDLDRHGVLFVESRPPRPNPSGTTLHQMKAVFAALDRCPTDALVLKLRTDKLDFSNAAHAGGLVNLLSGAIDLERDPDDDWPPLLEGRIAVSGGMLHRPFNHADQVFFGRHDDLMRLLNFDFRYVELFPNMRPEQWWFSHPFIDAMPIFATYFTHAGFMPDDGIGARLHLHKMLENDFFLKVLVSYLVVLHKFFRVGWLSREDSLYGTADALLRRVTYEEWLFKVLAPHGCMPAYGMVSTPNFPNDCWIGPFLSGRLKADALGKRILAAHAQVSAFDYHRTYLDRRSGKQPEVDAFRAMQPPSPWGGR